MNKLILHYTLVAFTLKIMINYPPIPSNPQLNKILQSYKLITGNVHKTTFLKTLTGKVKDWLLTIINFSVEASGRTIPIKVCIQLVEHLIQYRDYPKCKTCKSYVILNCNYIPSFCKGSCVMNNASIKSKVIKTNIKKYGVEWGFKSDIIKDKSKKTWLVKYGVDNPVKSKIIKNKSKKTSLAKYGVENPAQNKQVQEKMQKTCIEKYGVKYSLQADEVREKIESTCLKVYGFTNPNKNSDIKKKISKTVAKLKKDPSYQKKINRKTRKTCRAKYGVNSPSQHPAIAEKQMKKAFNFKPYQLGNKTVYVQGYEPQALDYIFANYKKYGIRKNMIKIGRNQVPQIQYKFKGSLKMYFPDFYVPSKNLIIEVKSPYTACLGFTKQKAKRKACLSRGFNFKLMVFNEMGNLISSK